MRQIKRGRSTYTAGVVVLEIGCLTRTVSTARWSDDSAITRAEGLEVRAGRVTALTGPPRAGTSEILRTVFHSHIGGTGRILYRTRDGVRINLTTLDDEERLALQEQEFGFVGGVRRLPAGLSIVGHVARDLVASQGLTAAEARRKAQHALESFDIDADLLHRPGRDLTEELQTRVDLVRALTKAPRLLMLDEPVKRLPVSLHQRLVGRLRELSVAGTATLMACRSLWLLDELADDVLELPPRDSIDAVA